MTTSEVQALATALPEVIEKQHARFKVPLWQVRGRTVLGIGSDETSAVFFVTEESAEAAAARLILGTPLPSAGRMRGSASWA